ncbi:MAG: hypothetical protein ACTSRZ_11505 [Promethearchaeota archaeon]
MRHRIIRKNRNNFSIIIIIILTLITVFYAQGLNSQKLISDNTVLSKNYGNNQEVDLYLPQSAGDDSTWYLGKIDWIYYDEFTTSYGNFSRSTNDPDGSISRVSGNVVMTISGPINNYEDKPRLYDDTPPFYKAEISINWWVSGIEGGESLDLAYTLDNWNSHTVIASTSSTNSGNILTMNLTAESYNTHLTSFQIGIVLNANKWITDSDDDKGYINWIHMKVWEYEINETYDNIPQQIEQTISVDVFPYNNASAIEMVYMRYSKSSDLSGYTESLGLYLGGHRFIFSIPDTYYAYNDRVYYQIVMNETGSGTEHYSHTSNYPYFDAIDVTDPSFENHSRNDESPEYNQTNFQVQIDVGQINGDSDIVNVSVFLSNSSSVDLSDPHILTSTSLPSSTGGTFIFNINEIYLAYNVLYYRFYAEDAAGNSALSSIYSVTIDDNYAPIFSGHSISNNKPEFNETVTVSYDISEPNDASGFNTDGSNIELRYKLNSIPSDYSDFDGIISVKNTPISQFSNTIQFDIDESLYDYNDTVYYWLYLEDKAGNYATDFINGNSFYVNDTTPPDVIKDPNNDLDSNYYADKQLIFNISEPTLQGASGVNLSTLELWFRLDDSNFANGGQMCKYTAVQATNFTFTILKGNLTLGHTMYYKLNGSDNAEFPNYFEISGSFNIIDLEPPFIQYTSSESNDTLAEYQKDVKITFYSDEVEFGVGFSQIILLIKNGSTPLETGDPNTFVITWNENISKHYSFLIPSIYLSARPSEQLYYRVKANDTNGNYRYFDGIITPADYIAPSINWNSDNATANEINHNEDFQVSYNIQEPRSGSGLQDSSLELYYYIGNTTDSPSSPFEYDGKITYSGSINPNGGIYSFILDESILYYGNRVYYWANVSDVADNSANTFSTLRFFDVVDHVNPLLSVNTSSTLPCSYDVDKPIIFSAIEPIDASGLSSVNVYYAIDNPSVSTSSYDGMVSNTNPTKFGDNFTLIIPKGALYGNYNKTMYFIVVAIDLESNTNISSVLSFAIIDLVVPNITQDPKNTGVLINDDNNKTIKISACDSDYPTCSGVLSITLYYKKDDPNVTTADNSLSIQESIEPLSLKNYTFIFNSSIFDGWFNGSKCYYIIVIEDTDGNTYTTPVQYFLVVDLFYMNLRLPKSATEKDYEFYYNTEQIHIEFICYYPSDIWYYIDGKPLANFTVYYGTHLDVYATLPRIEGLHNITVFCYSMKYQFTRNFTLDFTPPKPVILKEIKLNNAGFVELRWDLQEPEDPLATYEIWRKEGDNSFKKISTIGTGSRSYIDITVLQGKKYQYKVIVIDRAGNISVDSEIKTISTPLPFYIWLVLISAAVVSVLVVIRIVKSSKEKRSMKELRKIKVDKEDIDIDEDEIALKAESLKKKKTIANEEELFATDEFETTQWTPIDWKSKLEEQKKYAQYEIPPPETYWRQELENAVEMAIKIENMGNLAESLKYYKLALRLAEIHPEISQDIKNYLKLKTYTIFFNPLKDEEV